MEPSRLVRPSRLPAVAVLGLLLLHNADHAGPTLVQRAEITAPDAEPGMGFGSVRLSDDGNSALVLAVLNDERCWRAYFLTRGVAAWVAQQAIDPPGDHPNGCSVVRTALSGDGNTAVMSDSVPYVFVRDAGVWTLQAELTAPGLMEPREVALSDDGNTVLIGSDTSDCVVVPGPDPFYGPCGAAYVFVRNGDTWSLQQKLSRPDTEADGFGYSVGLSGDGNTAGVFSLYNDTVTGAVYMYVRSGNAWLLDQELVAAGAHDYSHFGRRIALSDDGTTALIGGGYVGQCAPGVSCGSVIPFQRSGNTWVELQQFQTNIDQGDAYFGLNIAISADATVALVSAPGKDCATGFYCGAAYLYRRNGNAWIQQQDLTVGNLEAWDAYASVAISDDGSVALIGAPGKDCCGVVYAFAQKCHESLIFEPDCPVASSSLDSWIGVGCEIVDCCPGCPGSSLIDWVVQVGGDPVDGVVLWFENLPPFVLRRLRLEGEGRWLDRNRLQIDGREMMIRGFSPAPERDLRASLRSTRVTLDRIVHDGTTRERRDDVGLTGERKTIRIRVQQKVGDVTIADSTLIFRRR